MGYFEDYAAAERKVRDDARARGVPLTDDEVAVRVEEYMNLQGGGTLGDRPVAVLPESGLEGAPSADIGVDLGLTPQGYMDDLGEMTDYYRDGGASQPPPGSYAYDLEGGILQYRPGMTQEEYDNAKAQQQYRVGMIRGMGGDGGFQAQVHPQQVMDIGTAEENAKWNEWVAEDPARMQRYDPAGFAAWQAAQEAKFVEDHYTMLTNKYGPEVAAKWRANRQSGGPVDFSITRTPDEEARVRARRETEMLARGGAEFPVDDQTRQDAREDLRTVDAASGYRGALNNADAAAGNGPDGKRETYGQRFARKKAERQSELDARKLLLRNQNLRGDPATRFTMMADPFGDGLTENQQRALAYMLPGGDLAAEVDAANFQQAADLTSRALGSTIAPLVTGALGGNDASPDLGGMAFEQAQQGNFTHPSVFAYAKAYYDTLWSIGVDRVQKTVDYLTITLPGMDEDTARRIAVTLS